VGYVADMLGTGPFLAGADFTLADICVSTTLDMWRGPLGQTLPDKLLDYHRRLAARPALERARKALAGTKPREFHDPTSVSAVWWQSCKMPLKEWTMTVAPSQGARDPAA
jgi:Glutathione S-transferase, C-terminal domain